MKFLSEKLGQAAVLQILGWGATIVVSLSGFFWSQLGSTNVKVDEIKVGATAIVERTAKLEEAISTIKIDNQEIKNDIKELLKRIK